MPLWIVNEGAFATIYRVTFLFIAQLCNIAFAQLECLYLLALGMALTETNEQT